MMRGFDSIESMHGEELLVKRKRGSKRCVIGALIIGGLFFLVGILIGYFSNQGDSSSSPEPHKLDPTHFIIQNVKKDFLQSKLKDFTSQARLAGTEGGADLAQTIQSLWSASGLDSVHISSYSVLLSFPNQSHPNKIELMNKTSGKAVFTSMVDEPDLRPEDNKSSIPSFNAFAPAGIAMGDVVYVNYARPEDFEYLTRNLSMDLTGKIVIARYGEIFRGNKVVNAQQYNASAVILYSDPADVNMADGSGDEKPYPQSWWMPSSGLQRGTVYLDNGDPDTPGYPATDYAYHIDKSKRLLPKIPCQPISYSDAIHILSNLSGPASPSSWHGTLPVSYNIGPGYENSTDLEVKITVNNYLATRPVHNVIGIIHGSEESDRYVLLGNHHDAWVYGGVDPQSGGIALAQVVDLFGQLLKKGYRPRRTLVFCSWDAEEYGLMGSTEWVEDHMKVLQERAVAYLNVDMAAEGNFTMWAATSPLLQDAIYSAAKQVPSPISDYKTLYDLWLARPNTDEDEETSANEPKVIYSLGAGSDHLKFYTLAGVSVADLSLKYDEIKYPVSSYPLYHSRYDDCYLYENYQDPGFLYTIALTQFWAILSNNLADTPLLPMNVNRYSAAVSKFINDLLDSYKNVWIQNKVNIDALLSAVQNFTEATAQFESNLAAEKDLDKKPNRLRMYNDKIIQLERAFINPEGLPDRPDTRHIVFAPSNTDAYVDTFFPGISDTMYNIDHGLDQWDRLKQQIFVTTYFIQSAARTLHDFGL